MVRRIDDKGGVYHEPPYTWDEEQELYRRMSGTKSLTRIHAGPRGPRPPSLPAEQSGPAPEPNSPDRHSPGHRSQSGAGSADPHE
jgi:hypothetical protein